MKDLNRLRLRWIKLKPVSKKVLRTIARRIRDLYNDKQARVVVPR